MLYGQELVDQVSKLFLAAKKRIWIAVPYIGKWGSVQRVTGTKWIGDLGVDMRVLTDANNEKGLSRDTIKVFQNRAEIRSLTGLHAKAYILDNALVLTSANLTGTAFSRRWEIGYIFSATKRNIKFFETWWKTADRVESNWLPAESKDPAIDPEEGTYTGLPHMWNLPDTVSGGGVFTSYLDQIKVYDHFKKLYLKSGRRVLPSLPIYQEIDDFMNFLFHEHEELPSRDYIKKRFRKISDAKRIIEIKKYMGQYRRWKSPSRVKKDDRLERIKTFQHLLRPSNIRNLTRADIATVAHWINAVNSYRWNYTAFMDAKNNSTATVRKAWAILLHDKTRPLEVRMQNCNAMLFKFGKSSIQELLSYYYPNTYPVVNRNPNAGLKFFGYNVRTY